MHAVALSFTNCSVLWPQFAVTVIFFTDIDSKEAKSTKEAKSNSEYLSLLLYFIEANQHCKMARSGRPFGHALVNHYF